MAWTSPRTWNPGETVTAALMNAHVRDNLNVLKTKIADDGKLIGRFSDAVAAAAGNVGSGETEVYSKNMPAGTLGANGDTLHLRAGGTFAANATTKTVKFKLGNTSLTLTNLGWNAKNWWLDVRVARRGATSQVVSALLVTGTLDSSSGVSSPHSTTFTEDLGTALDIKLTAQGGANDDIVLDYAFLSTHPGI